jgi:hypothetical protein
VKDFKHQLCQSEPDNVHDFSQDSQSDEELSNLEVVPDKGSTDPPLKRFESCYEIELDKISQARNEKNTNKQTAWGVKYRQTDSRLSVFYAPGCLFVCILRPRLSVCLYFTKIQTNRQHGA